MIKKMMYDAVYILPVLMALLLWYLSDNSAGRIYIKSGIISITVTAVGILLLHLKAEGKIILSGILISAVLAVFFICPEELREKLLTEHVDILICISIAAAVFFITRLLISFSAGRLVLGLTMVTLLIAALAMGESPDKLIVVLMLGTVFSVAADEIQVRWKKKGDTGHREHLAAILPFIILFIICILIAPVSDKPYDWGFVKRIVASAAEQIEKIENKMAKESVKGYGDTFIGFSEEPGFGAELKPNDHPVLDAYFGAGVPFAVYLYGKSFDTFSGREWDKSYTEESADRKMDTLELVYGVSLDPDADPNEYYRDSYLRLRLQADAPEYLFAPDKILKLNTEDETLNVKEAGGDLYYDRTDGAVSYSVRYYYINNNSPSFIKMAAGMRADDENVWREVTEEYSVSDNSEYSYDNYLVYRERMKSVYLPETKVSERMESFLNELMEGADSDMEKLRRIEALLSSMEYSVNPGPMPPEVDTAEEFLDHLIFETQTGYCVYYATAFVLLARYEGIPARYVQGFRVIPQKYSAVTVTGNSAHAWPECYINGVGWVIFEPTPGYKVDRYWLNGDDNDIADMESVSFNHTVSVNAVSADATDEAEEKAAGDNGSVLYYAVLIMVITVIVTLFLMFAIIVIRKLQFFLMNDEKKFVTMFEHNMRMLHITGLDIGAGETLEEFIHRAGAVVPSELLGFVTVYEEYLYKGAVLRQEDMEKMRKANNALMGYVKNLGMTKRLRLFWTLF